MSFRAMVWAWEVDGLTSTSKLVLMSLAQHANEDGRNSFPSIQTIAAECRLSDRTVQRALTSLVEEEYVLVVPRPGTTTLFSLRMDLHVVARRDRPRRGDTVSGVGGDTMSPPRGDTLTGGGDTVSGVGVTQSHPRGDRVSPEPVLEPKEKEDARAIASEAGAGSVNALFGHLPPDDAPPPPPHSPAEQTRTWMPRLSDPEHRWAQLAPVGERDPRSMSGELIQTRSGWHLKRIAMMVAEAAGWHDQRTFTDWRPLCTWLDDGICPHDTIIPTIRRVMANRSEGVQTLAYFDKPVRQAAGTRRTGS